MGPSPDLYCPVCDVAYAYDDEHQGCMAWEDAPEQRDQVRDAFEAGIDAAADYVESLGPSEHWQAEDIRRLKGGCAGG